MSLTLRSFFGTLRTGRTNWHNRVVEIHCWPRTLSLQVQRRGVESDTMAFAVLLIASETTVSRAYLTFSTPSASQNVL